MLVDIKRNIRLGIRGESLRFKAGSREVSDEVGRALIASGVAEEVKQAAPAKAAEAPKKPAGKPTEKKGAKDK